MNTRDSTKLMSGGSMFKAKQKLLKKFIYFSQRQYDCLDYDPFHPIFKEAGKKMAQEEGLWLSTLFMAYYNDGSAWLAFNNSEPFAVLSKKLVKLPIGVQRRNLYGGRLGEYFKRLRKQIRPFGTMQKFLTQGFVGDKKKDWNTLQINLELSWTMLL